MAILKIARWVLTALLAFAWLTTFDDGVLAIISNAVLIGFVLLLLWLLPHAFMRQRSTREPVTFRDGFEPNERHDNIALDTLTDLLWIRDSCGAERYLERGDIIGFKTAHEWNNGTFRQRIELDIQDVRHPRWQVLFQRHSDAWKKTTKHNTRERDEWFARLRAWSMQAPNLAAQARAAGVDQSVLLHRHYHEASTDEQRHNYHVAFDIRCLTAGFDQQTEWERLGGTYPGPSPDLLKFKRA